MKHLLGITILLAGCSAACFADTSHLDIKVSDRVENDLYGPVKHIITDIQRNLSGEHTKQEQLFDEAGNLLSEKKWDEEGDLVSTTERIYEDGCWVKEITEVTKKRDDSEETIKTEWVVILNPETRQIARRDAEDGSIEIDTYSPEKYHMNRRVLDDKKKVIYSSLFKRRDDNRETEYRLLNDSGRPEFIIHNQWTSDASRLNQQVLVYVEEKEKYRNTFEYLKEDEHGNWTQCIRASYLLEGTDKDKSGERTIIRTIEYFEEEAVAVEDKEAAESEAVDDEA